MVLPSFTGFYLVLLGFTGFYWVLLGYTWFYLVLLGFTMFYWVLLGFTGFYWVLLGITWFYWVIPCFPGGFSRSGIHSLYDSVGERNSVKKKPGKAGRSRFPSEHAAMRTTTQRKRTVQLPGKCEICISADPVSGVGRYANWLFFSFLLIFLRSVRFFFGFVSLRPFLVLFHRF